MESRTDFATNGDSHCLFNVEIHGIPKEIHAFITLVSASVLSAFQVVIPECCGPFHDPGHAPYKCPCPATHAFSARFG